MYLRANGNSLTAAVPKEFARLYDLKPRDVVYWMQETDDEIKLKIVRLPRSEAETNSPVTAK